jgi:hypothetical protein
VEERERGNEDYYYYIGFALVFRGVSTSGSRIVLCMYVYMCGL